MSAGQNSFLSSDWVKTSSPLLDGRKSSTTTSTHSPNCQNLPKNEIIWVVSYILETFKTEWPIWFLRVTNKHHLEGMTRFYWYDLGDLTAFDMSKTGLASARNKKCFGPSSYPSACRTLTCCLLVIQESNAQGKLKPALLEKSEVNEVAIRCQHIK